MIEFLEMYELVNHHVVAYPVGHGDQPPVQADVSVSSARTPSRPLVSNADARHAKPVLIGQGEESRRQFLERLRLQPMTILSREPYLVEHRALSLHPLDVTACEGIGLPLRAAARNRDAEPSVLFDAQQIPAGSAVADEVQGGDRTGSRRNAGADACGCCRLRHTEGKPQLHLDRIPDSHTPLDNPVAVSVIFIAQVRGT